jgi:protease I
MNKALLGEKIAVLIANGFCEHDLTETQKSLQKYGANVRIVSMDQGLVHSWNGENWGLHYAADTTLNTALAADYSILVIPGGQRSIEKLKLTAHTKRFIGGFLNAHKPVIAFDEALELLVFCEKVEGRTVTGPDALEDAVVKGGGQWLNKPYAMDGSLMTGGASRGPRDIYIKAITETLVSGYAVKKAA